VSTPKLLDSQTKICLVNLSKQDYRSINHRTIGSVLAGFDDKYNLKAEQEATSEACKQIRKELFSWLKKASVALHSTFNGSTNQYVTRIQQKH